MNKILNMIIQRIILILSLIHFVLTLECINNVILIFEKNSSTHHYLGCEINNWKGEKCTAFRGIRYAKSPIGELRFKISRDPLPIGESSFDDARKDGSDCPSIFTNDSSEDCLFLNVYSKATNKLRPVIVFIHPGGLYLGSGKSTFLGPEYLLEKDVVIVTFNYRLGSLGFLNLGTSDVPGNAGFKDQVMAIRWVKNNIQYFGGDPNNITLMGYSAGAFSVCLHLVSPMSQGLFHKAVIMSGSIPPQTKIHQNNQLKLAEKQAALMGCKEELSIPNTILECLSSFNEKDISKTLRKMFHFGKDNPIYLWLPVIEENFGQERFLIENPYDSFNAGRFAKVPILIGFTNGEFCTSAKDILTSEDLLYQFKQNFEMLSPTCFMYSEHEKEEQINDAILSEYFKNNTNFDATSFESFCDVFSDSIIRFGVNKIASTVAKYVNVYRYRFSYNGSASYLKYPNHSAVEHMDDLMYLFKMPIKQFSPGDSESKVVENMVNFFTTFFENGKPETDFEFKMNKYIELGAKIEVKNGTYFEIYRFWEKVTNIS